MATTVELLYQRGVLVDACEMKDGLPRQWGRAETPARGYVVVRIIGKLKDIPVQYLQRVPFASRMMLSEDLMSEEEKTLFKDKERFVHMDHAVKHTITVERLVKLCVDNTTAWETAATAMAQKQPIVRPEVALD